MPFPVESRLSGIERRVDSTVLLWYRREFEWDSLPKTHRLVLHFDKVDYETVVYLNQHLLDYRHLGGYEPFSYDITDYLSATGANELIVRVWDPSNHGFQARGKQMLDVGANSIFYTPCSGIWGTVWLEQVPRTRVHRIEYRTEINSTDISLFYRIDLIDVRHEFSGANSLNRRLLFVPRGERIKTSNRYYEERGFYLKINLFNRTNASIFSWTTNQTNRENQLEFSRSDFELWSPETPFLYDLHLDLYRDNKLIDRVDSYLAFRQITLCQQPKKICLNHQPYFMYGVLDQGYWPDGLYRSADDESYRNDIVQMKQLGFNTLRKHMKIETSRWYYWCDVVGMLVWQDMPSGDSFDGFELELDQDKQLRLHRDNRTNNLPTRKPRHRPNQIYRREGVERDYQSKIAFESELKAMIDMLSFHPSIVVWVLFNEEWGQYDTIRLGTWIEYYDPTRLVNAASGWQDRVGVGHMRDIHDYTRHIYLPPIDDHQRALVLGECGGFGLKSVGWSYNSYNDRYFLTYAFEQLIVKLSTRLSAMIYTQLSDVETESNGIMTYDRKIMKFQVDHVKRVLNRDYSRLYKLEYIWNLTSTPLTRFSHLTFSKHLHIKLTDSQKNFSRFYFYICYLDSRVNVTIDSQYQFRFNQAHRMPDYHYVLIPANVFRRNTMRHLIDIDVYYDSLNRHRNLNYTFFDLSLAMLYE